MYYQEMSHYNRILVVGSERNIVLVARKEVDELINRRRYEVAGLVKVCEKYWRGEVGGSERTSGKRKTGSARGAEGCGYPESRRLPKQSGGSVR